MTGSHDFIDETRLRSGLETTAEARRAIGATLRTLAERLSPEIVSRLASELPRELAMQLRTPRSTAGHVRSFAANELYARVARREGVTVGFAREHAQAVCTTVARALPEEIVEAVRRDLDPDLALLFEPLERERATPPPAHASKKAHGHTLASGAPGSRHPIAEADVLAGHADSVARSSEPHADTKLSSSPGLTQEREHHTLAAGKAGSTRPIAETKE
ncbi:MAG: hypothetical protein JWM74_2980 [Myxococcaceae bacterium]|nr:hypothetical protein [Myxococcaceae bacterium]